MATRRKLTYWALIFPGMIPALFRTRAAARWAAGDFSEGCIVRVRLVEVKNAD